MSSTWNHCLCKLENEIPSNEFSAWIGPLQAIENKNTLQLLAPNDFIVNHIQQHFLEKIKHIVGEFSNGLLVVHLKISPRPAVTPTQNIKQVGCLNKAFSFDNFVEGRSNELAKAAAMQVSENMSPTYNPLLIYGGSGMGKTHLMHAIGNTIINRNPHEKICYLHAEKWVNEMVKAFQHKNIDKFKNYYHSIKVLLVDDIQFLAKKDRSQEEFFHIFNILFDKQHQMVLTCDKYPKEIDGLEERLKSRFGWGLPVIIEPPDLETRASILTKKANQFNVNLPLKVAFFIAEKIPSNVRELEGALRLVIARAKFINQEITINLTQDALHNLILLQNKLISIDNIQTTVAQYFNIRVMDLCSKSRQQSITRPRQIAMYLVRELTSRSFPEIGAAFGGRNHTTVISACKRIQTLKTLDSKVLGDYKNLLRSLSC